MNTKKAILIVSFGSSYKKARENAIEAVEKSIQKTFPSVHITSAYTSYKIIAKLKKQDIHFNNPQEALEELIGQGYNEIFVQPLHLIPGFEYEKIQNTIKNTNHSKVNITLGEPLFFKDEDYLTILKAIKKQWTPQQDECLLLVGHGTEHKANKCYERLQEEWNKEKLPVIIGTIEEGTDKVLEMLKQGNYKKVLIMPLLLVAGDHAINDLDGEEEDSWKNQLKALGYDVTTHLKGLGENPYIQQIYVNKTKSLIQEEKKYHYIQNPIEIENKSFDIIHKSMKNTTVNPIQLSLIKRVIHTTTEFEYEDLIQFKAGIEDKFVTALENGCTIVTDTEMIRAGISKTLATKLGVKVECYVGTPKAYEKAQSNNTTRSMAAVDMALETPSPKIFVIGNAPTALYRIIENDNPDIVGVIGVPVGFVGAEESKEALWESEIPSIITQGKKGGSTIAVAMVNALLREAVKVLE
ncbi:precorrin-8X methylmutase [Natranaerovirga hydrolytica]|uniref:Precorrin-8X methylmutase n=1 Tax=Natranaerovirga hydrolytica TaxID=680378 RepID=A0A4R1N144_9FIRM|nr:precorrin-8X methylmutase [Natranaerovirga hydrolytica]TCK98660.1 precorrin-8X methylmutase [Natranaerovirga hydrolytica]